MLSLSKTGKTITFTLGKNKKRRRFKTVADSTRFIISFARWMERQKVSYGIFSFSVFGYYNEDRYAFKCGL